MKKSVKMSAIARAAKVLQELEAENARLRRERADSVLFLCMACLQNENHEVRVKSQMFDPSKYTLKRYNDEATGEIVTKLEEKPE